MTGLAALAGLVFSQSVARADLEIKYDTSLSHFGNGTQKLLDLTFTPATFDGHTSGDIPSVPLGTFTLTAPTTGRDSYNGNTFTLTLQFYQPPDTSPNPSSLLANLTGTVQRNAHGGVNILWNSDSQSFTGGGWDFTFTLLPTGVNESSTNTRIDVGINYLNASVTASQTPITTTTAVNEPQAIATLLTMLLGLGFSRHRRLFQ